MDIGKIKNIITQNGDKFIVVENGEPEFVVMSFTEYQKLLGRDTRTSDTNARIHANDLNTMNDKNKELYETEFARMGLHETAHTAKLSAPVVVEPTGLPVRLEDIRLEDLPI